MRVWSVGAGAVGGTVAVRLARAGIEPLVLDANRDHVLRLREPGLLLAGLEDGAHTKLAAYTPDDAGAELEASPDIVLLAVRSHATRTALESLLDHIGPRTDVVSLQNGLNEDAIAEVVGAQRTIGCVVGFGATWISPGHVTLDADGRLTIGRLDGTLDDRLEAARDLLAKAFATRITPNVRGDLWAKMLVNSMTVLGALGGMLTGEVLATPERRRIVADVVAEGVRVARASGVALPDVFGLVSPDLVDEPPQWSDALEAALAAVRETAGPIKSVTLRDFELGRSTEIDAVTGEIVRRGLRTGVPTPLSVAVYAMLQEIEQGTRSSEPANFDALGALSRPL